MNKNTQSSRLFIHADNVHAGGGAILLKALINSISASYAYLQVDARMNLDGIQSTQSVIKVAPTILSRFKSQLWLRASVEPDDNVLCFGNLPPLFKVKGRVIVFVQNKYVIDKSPLKNFPLKTKIRLVLERLWFRWRGKFANEFIVQTPSMKDALESLLQEINIEVANGVVVKVLPLINAMPDIRNDLVLPTNHKVRKSDFIYPASGEPHKNHKMLIDAFVILAKEGVFPKLVLTIDEARFPGVYQYLKDKVEKFKLNITNLGFLDHHQLTSVYRETSCLLYPSLYESFGMPLIEAKQAGLPIIASELDYVRDSVYPDETFDPRSATSIARAIKRHLGMDTLPNELLDGERFLQKIISSHHDSRGL